MFPERLSELVARLHTAVARMPEGVERTSITLTWLTLAGVQKIGWRWLENPSQRVIGGLLCLLGIATVTFAH